MFCATAFTVCLVVASCFAIQTQKQNLHSSILAVENLDEYLNEHPEVEPLQELTKFVEENDDSSSWTPKFKVTYELGNRTDGDRLVGMVTQGISWGTPRDYQYTLDYPESSDGTVITYVQVIAQQASFEGRGYVTSGDIGQSQITIIVEAKSTLYFACEGRIYVGESDEQTPTTTTTSSTSTTTDDSSI